MAASPSPYARPVIIRGQQCTTGAIAGANGGKEAAAGWSQTWPSSLERCAELLGIDLATVRELAAGIEPYIRSDGTKVWSLMQLERQLRPEAYRRRRGGYLDRRRTPPADA